MEREHIDIVDYLSIVAVKNGDLLSVTKSHRLKRKAFIA